MTGIVSMGQVRPMRLWFTPTDRSAIRLTAALLLAWLLSCAAGSAQADDSCGLGEVRLGIKRLAPANSTTSEWVEPQVLDEAASSLQAIPVEGTLVAIAFSRHIQASAMEAPRDFTFRSGWLLNSQFAFRRGDRFRIRARYDVPSGATYYALMPPNEPYLTIFAKPDGTLCNKVMNTNAGDHSFLVREYKSWPVTKLVMDTQRDRSEPMVLKVVYLGTVGGVASFREVWSQQGRILQTADHHFDPGATRLRIAVLDIEVASMNSVEVSARVSTLPRQLAWSPYWVRRFGD